MTAGGASAAPGAPAAVEYRHVRKAFGACVANDDVTFSVGKGTLHCLVGENGAGKTTALKMLFGLFPPTSGEILLHGRPFRPRSPVDAVASGIGMVHQHFMLSETETALDNVLLAVESVKRDPLKAVRPLARSAALERLRSLAKEYGLEVDFLALVERLSVGEQQRLEILKLLFLDADVLVLDEPTAVLTPQETAALFLNLRALKARGKTIVVITHKLKEVVANADAVTILRQGRLVDSFPMDRARVDEELLASLMVGRAVKLSLRDVPRAPSHEEVLLDASRITLPDPRASQGKPRLDDVSLSVRAGEIVGVAGVEGNGQSALLSLLASPASLRAACLAGARHKGTPAPALRVLGQDGFLLDARGLRSLSYGFVPEDRIHQALLPEESLAANFLLGRQHRPEFRRFGLLSGAKVRAAAAAGLSAFDVRPPDPSARARSLSGGNQQKVVLAREMALSPRLLVVAQPTRGVDVGAIEAIHRRLLEARNAGVGILLVSSELEEILSLADRVVVFYEGRITGCFDAATADETVLGLCMGGKSP